VNSDATIVSGGTNGMPTLTKVLLIGESSVYAGYDAISSSLVFKTQIKYGQSTGNDPMYLAIGFGSNMTNTDMISWEATNSVATSLVQKLYSSGEQLPSY